MKWLGAIVIAFWPALAIAQAVSPQASGAITPSSVAINGCTLGSNSLCVAGETTLTGAANTNTLAIVGGSITGSNTVSPGISVTGTLNTTGVVSGAGLSIAVTDTAHGSGTTILNVLGGSGGITPLFGVDTTGRIFSNNIQVVYVPNQSSFTDTIYFGNGGASLYHVSGTDGYYNSALGVNALYNNTSGGYNSAIGYQALYNNTSGGYNSAIGAYALYRNTSGYNNSAIGLNALHSNTTGNSNSAIGYQALYNNTTGNTNSAIGASALYDLGSAQVAGAFNIGTSYTIASIGTTDFTLIGAGSNTVGVVFTATGAGSGTGTATPNTNSNSAIGYNTGGGIIYGINNTIVGAGVTGLASGLSNSIILATGDGTIRASFGLIAGAWYLGAADAASPVAQTLGFQGATGSNNAGANATVIGSLGTGNAVSGSLIFKTGIAHGSDSVQQTATTALTLDASQNGNFASGIAVGSPTGGASAGYVNVATGYKINNATIPTFASQNVVTGSRALGTVYQNTTGKTMMVAVSGYVSASGEVQFLSDANNPPTTPVAQYSNSSGISGAAYCATFMVLNGNYYEGVDVS